MAAVSEDPITLWLKLGALEKLEQVVLDGYGDQLYGKTSRIPQVNKFLRQVPIFQSKIDEIHKAVSTGSLRDVQHLIDRKKLAFCRDHLGASPMHKAVLFSQKPVIDYLLDRYPSVVHARDHRGRTPLHYAAVLSDGGDIYKMLLDHGADVKATDVYGNRPEYYMHAQDEMDLEALREGNDKPPPKVNENIVKHFQHMGGNQVEGPRSAKVVGSRTQIREMIVNGSLEQLEELVLQGHGDRLLGESATNPIVKDFIRMVPVYMERIYEIHRAVTRGRLRDVQTLLDRKKLALSRDPLGATPLHKAVMYGHKEVVEYIATNFPLSKDAKDLEGRTPLHYAAALRDNHEIYNLLVALSANPLALDYRGKTAEYYLQFPEHLHLEQMIKQSQRTNANYMANNASRLKAASPKRKSPYPARASVALDVNGNINSINDETKEINNVEKSTAFKMPKKALFRSQPLLPPPKLKRLEINSANIKRWVREEDLEKLEDAVLEGFGEKVALQKSESEKLQKYINDQVPLLVRKIEAIHIAVTNDDITELQNHLQDTDHMVLAKDHFGMAPIHRAVLMNKRDTLAFLIDRFPETVNARDKEGRTALHYAAAMSREPNGASNYFKTLLEAGADPRIRDNQGRSPEYYRTHQVPIPHKLNLQQKKKLRSKSEPPLHKAKKLPGINGGGLPQVTMDKITGWFQSGDVDSIREFVSDGYGQHLVGKTSWNEDVRQYIKTLPSHLLSVGSAFHAVERGDRESLEKQLQHDDSLLRTRNSDGVALIHSAVLHDQLNIINYFLDKYPQLLNLKDRMGRTPLHVAGQQRNQYLYSVLAAAGADPMILDQKGRTAEFYMNSTNKITNKPTHISPTSSSPENDSSDVKSPEDDQPPVKEKEEEEEVIVDDKEEKQPEELLPTEEHTEDIQEEKKEENEEENEEEKEEGEMEKETGKEEEEEIVGIEEKKEEEAEEPDSAEKDFDSPPEQEKKGSSSSADRLNELIDVWIRDKDLLRLEHVVIAGQGDRLVGRSSSDRQVQEFLELVPTYMARIRGVHEAVIRGSLGEVESVLTRKRFALSRDQLGASPLHLAVLHGHSDIVKYIIDNFPEALDGPDNEGRTPLHYAAVMRDGGNYYKILLMAGADETVKDKSDRTPDYYLTHPGVLTIRDLLEGYRIRENQSPSQVNIWQRPPTDEAEKLDLFDHDSFGGETPDFADTPTPEGTAEEKAVETEMERSDQQEEAQSKPLIDYPILFDRQNKDSRYLAGVLGDALVKGLAQVAQRRPSDPIGYLATYLYQYAAMKSSAPHTSSEPEVADDEEEEEEEDDMMNADEEEKEDARVDDLRSAPLDVLAEDPEEMDDDDEEFSLEFEDHTKMKDEEGQTVLHFAAARVHPDGSFYGLLSHAEVLIAERDVLYRTCRDVAEDSDKEDNVMAIDRFIFDAFQQPKTSLIRMLLHEGYDHMIHIRDPSGQSLISVLEQKRLHTSHGLAREVTEFVRKREELYGFIRKNYLEGVARLAKSDGTLVSAKGTRSRSALHIAVLFQHIGIITALVKANSSAVHVTDNLGRTPLHYAMAMDKVDKIAKILISAGALKTTKDVRMRTPSFFFIYKEEIERLRDEELRLA
ncbi:uncharacterized protein [Parasteatoda tepidariorum]|uniref:uncharacterized protein n=1 Tax=Parasteatoda tepidariorum TaxID=114398 RepID=UPI001C726B16|nr:uncharacterized protein LOC107438162 [Parasteatoda tepidariorum]